MVPRALGQLRRGPQVGVGGGVVEVAPERLPGPQLEHRPLAEGGIRGHRRERALVAGTGEPPRPDGDRLLGRGSHDPLGHAAARRPPGPVRVLGQHQRVGGEVVAVELGQPGGDLDLDAGASPPADRGDDGAPQQRVVEPVARAVVVEQARVAGLPQQDGHGVVHPGDGPPSSVIEPPSPNTAASSRRRRVGSPTLSRRTCQASVASGCTSTLPGATEGTSRPALTSSRSRWASWSSAMPTRSGLPAVDSWSACRSCRPSN